MARATSIPVARFDPNNLPPNFYGLYSDGRFTVGNNRASIIQKAYNAGSNWSLWEWRDGQWVRVGYRRDIGDGYCCDECGQTLRRVVNTRFGPPHTKLEGDWGFKRTRGRIDSPLRYMRFCARCELDNQ